MPILRGIMAAFFSTKCLGCGLEVPFLGLCEACITRLTPREGAKCPTCDRLLQRREGAYPCGDCIRRPPPFETVFGIFDYCGPAGRAISLGKYQGCPEAVDWVARAAVQHCPVALIDDPPMAIVDVPATWKRSRRRGFRPPQLIAHRCAQALQVPLVSHGLRRQRQTAEQTGLNLKERRRNVRKAFHIQGSLPRDVLVVDDVYTTGSTVSEVSRVLKRNGVERIRVLTACYVDDANARPIPAGRVSG